MSAWKPFPFDHSEYLYEGEQLLQSWPLLHTGDRVVFPDTDWVQSSLEQAPDAAPDGFDGDVDTLAASIQDAWRCFHAGDFERSVKLAGQCGQLAHAAANKAAGIYATYLETNDKSRQACYLSAVVRSEAAQIHLPDDPNSHYFHAFNLGRYSQSISVATALRQGIGGKIKSSLDKALRLQPDHAEAHTALGLYHAEIVSKIGKMVGRVTYGATAEQGLEHLQRAIELTPLSPIAHMEYGNGLYLLFGDKKIDEVTELYVKASELHPHDAMEALDATAAKDELE